MRLTQLVTHWEPDETLAMIQFLDQLKEQLWSAYGEAIVQQTYAEQKPRIDEAQMTLAFDDPIRF